MMRTTAPFSTIVAVILVMAFGAAGPAAAADQETCTVIPFDPAVQASLEPSGLVWDPSKSILVGVSDNFNDLTLVNAGEYAIFWTELPAQDSEFCYAHPLLSPAEAEKIKPYDLEGVTQGPDGTFYATGSLSLHTKNPDRDIWYRFQAYQFDVVADQTVGYRAANVNWLSAEKRRDIREFFISSGLFTLKQIKDRPETGEGINVEGLAVSHLGRLWFGFRGPMQHQDRAQILATSIPEPTEEPKLISGPLLETPKANYGIRAIEQLTYQNWYAVVVGPTDTAHAPLLAFVWNWGGGEAEGVVTLPDGFVAEGIAPIKYADASGGKKKVTVAIVDDKDAKLIIKEFEFKP